MSLKAHYDGERIVLHEPFDLAVNASLMVTVLSAEIDPLSRERADWARLGVQSLAAAFGENEPDYTVADLRDPP